mgnify:FL=1
MHLLTRNYRVSLQSLTRMSTLRLFSWIILGLSPSAWGLTPPLGLSWDTAAGVICRVAEGDISLGGGTNSPLTLRVPTAGGDRLLSQPTVLQDAAGLHLTYTVSLPSATVTVSRDFTSGAQSQEGMAVTEKFRIQSSVPLSSDVEVLRPWVLNRTGNSNSPWKSVWPVITGWASPTTLTTQTSSTEYRMGNHITGAETPQLSLPIVEYNGGALTASLYSDALFGTLFEQRSPDGNSAAGTVRFRYSSRVPTLDESRTFAVWLRPGNPTATVPNEDITLGFPATMDGFFRLVMPDVPAGPQWTRDIKMVSYDYLSDGGLGYERDVVALAAMLTPAERAKVAICFHGWYDGFSYCYDETTGQLKNSWNAFPATRNVPYTKTEVRRLLQRTKDFGFRVLMYYADGVLTDSGHPSYRVQRALRNDDGSFISGWQGPDTLGPTHAQNPAHPDVRAFYQGYSNALITEYGSIVDGFVWDETFYVRTGMIATQPTAAYADRAMMTLVDAVRRNLKTRLGPEKVILTSDAVGIFGWRDVPPSALWADGTYQDTHCRPSVQTFGFFPNWRNCLWSCNWEPITHFDWNQWGVQTYGAPVAISNGWADDKGAFEWSVAQRDNFLNLFRQNLQAGPPPRWCRTDPAITLLSAPPEGSASSLAVEGLSNDQLLGDDFPIPLPSEKNWALTTEGSTASATSQTPNSSGGVWSPAGLIDGIRDDTGWYITHGWASQAGTALPQSVQIDFSAERAVRQFVVVTYHKLNSQETAAKWGVTNYRIEAWDETLAVWKTVVTENASRTVKTRVHTLPTSIKTKKFRVVVLNVAPLDGQARLLQIEAWGSPIPAPPSNLESSAIPSGIRTSWLASTSVGATYQVKRATSANGPFTNLGSLLTALSFDDISVLPGTTYFYRVHTVANAVPSADSITVSTVAWTRYQNWKHQKFDSIAVSNTADTDGNGLSNLLDYALSTDGNNPVFPQVSVLPNQLAITFSPSLDPTLIYAVERSSNLNNWTQFWLSPSSDIITRPITVVDPMPIVPNDKRFLRMKVTFNE